MSKRLSFNTVVAAAVRDAFAHPSYWLPALFLLAPTLVLQLAVPTYLRTRLAPAAWTVAVGAVLLVWLAQVAVPAACALVYARRAGVRRTLDLPLMRLSLVVGTGVTLGLAAAVLPGLWLQARYAFAPLASAWESREAQGRLRLVAFVALLVSTLGQSAVAALAEAMGTITAAGELNGRTVFHINTLPHALTTVAAYAWSSATLTVHALCVCALFDESRGVQRVDAPARDLGRARLWWVRGGQVSLAAAGLGAVVAAVYKVQQHL